MLLPVAAVGQGCLRLRLRLADVIRHYVVPATVSPTGKLEVTLVFPS